MNLHEKKREHVEYICARYSGVTAVRVARKTRRGRTLRRMALVIYVAKKLPAERVPVGQRIDLDEVLRADVGRRYLDVQQAGPYSIRIPKFRSVERIRPVPRGVSIGHKDITAGTTGPLAVLPDGTIVSISNNHVLANSNRGHLGDACLQPGPYDGGMLENDKVGELLSFVPIRFDGRANLVDAAMRSTQFDELATIHDLPGAPQEVWDVEQGMEVFTRGRTEPELSFGDCIDVDAAVQVGYGDNKTALFDGVPMFDGPNFSQPGDSGSLIMALAFGYPAVALLFAGDGKRTTIGCHMRDVLTFLGVKLHVAGEAHEPPERPDEPDQPPIPPIPGCPPISWLVRAWARAYGAS
jgi:hypothetical protein